MRRAGLLALALLGPCAARPAAAQRQADEARLTIGVGLLHTSGGGQLWSVGRQPILDGAGTDTLSISRRLTSGLGFSFHGAYFPSTYYGIAGEVLVTRLGTGDDCRLRSAAATLYASDLCGSLQNNEASTSTASLSAGVMLRPGLRGTIQPFARAMGGILIAQKSFAATDGFVRTPDSVVAVAAVYRDEDVTTTSPYLSFGVGFAAGIAPGWQARVEVRDTWVRLPMITGATSRQGVEPTLGRRGHHLLSFVVSVDVVLERKRGRRY